MILGITAQQNNHPVGGGTTPINHIGSVSRGYVANEALSFSAMNLQQDDYVLLLQAIGCRSNELGALTLNEGGWSTVSSGVFVDGADDVNYKLWGKVMGASPDASVSAPYVGTSVGSGILSASGFRGVNTANPVHALGTNAQNASYGSSVNFNALTVSIANAYIAAVVIGARINSHSLSIPDENGNAIDFIKGQLSTDSVHTTSAVAGMAKADAAGTGSKNFTNNFSFTNAPASWASRLVALNPA